MRALYVPNTPTLLDVKLRPDGFPEHPATIQALSTIGDAWQALNLDAIVVITPHFFSQDFIPFIADEHITQIYDLDGFPESFYGIPYPAVGATDLAQRLSSMAVQQMVPLHAVKSWGLDHGAWTPLSRLFPTAPCPLLPIGTGWRVSDAMHQKAGQLISAASTDLKIGVIATGSLYHRLDLWTGTDRMMPKTASKSLDHILTALRQGDFTSAFQIDTQDFAQLAPEGGFKPLALLAGTLEGLQPQVHDWAEESEFGAVSLSTIEFIV